MNICVQCCTPKITHRIKGNCYSCYGRKWRLNNPEKLKEYRKRWNPIWQKIFNPRRIQFKDKVILLKENPRTGECSKCHKKVGEGIKITRDVNNNIIAKGWPASAGVGVAFGILLLIVGILAIFSNPVVAAIILLLANIILYASRRHGNGARNRKLVEAIEKDKQTEVSQKEKIEFEEFKKWKSSQIENQKHLEDWEDKKDRSE